MTTAARPQHTGMIVLSIMLATIMQALDTTIANVALPHMQGTLNASHDQATWILTSYIVAAAIMTAPTGFLSSRLGRKRLFLIAIAGFTLSSVLCGAAISLNQMVFFRLMQGVFGACLIPLSQAVLLDIYPRERHGQAMALWGMGVMLGPILGPTLGGWLTEYYNWRYVFYINLPVGIAAFLGVMTFMPETEKSGARKFDMLGFVLLSLFIGALQLMLDRGQGEDWFSSAEIVAEAVIAGLCLYLFVVHVLTTDHPFLDPAMFKDRNYSICLVFIFVIGIVLLAGMALLPPFLQDLMGYPVLLTGMVLAPRGIGTMAAMMIGGRLVGKVDPRLLIAVGLTLTAWSLYQMSLFTADVPAFLIIRNGVIQGFGMGFVFVSLSTLAYATLAPRFRNDATAVFSLGRNMGSSVGISIVIALLARNTQINHAELGAGLLPFGRGSAAIEVLGDAGVKESEAALAMLNAEVTRQAATISYLNDFLLMAIVVLAALPLLLLLKRPQRDGKLAQATTATE